jgi:hypothetical protein
LYAKLFDFFVVGKRQLRCINKKNEQKIWKYFNFCN